MRIIKQLTDNKFLNLKEIHDPDTEYLKGYLFAERLGKDSVAFICWHWDRNGDEYFLLNKEFKPPVDKFILGAFGGSMDKNKSPEQIVIDEVKEEAGFEVSKDDVHYVGKVMVSTQMNQFCYLFLVNVDKNKQQERQPENEMEAMAETKWILRGDKEMDELEDWKPTTIISKAEAKSMI